MATTLGGLRMCAPVTGLVHAASAPRNPRTWKRKAAEAREEETEKLKGIDDEG
jgi:hypothetical protein